MSDPNIEPDLSGIIGGTLPPDGSAGATGFSTGVPAPSDVDPQDAELEGGDDSAGAPDAPAGDGAV
ncbi:hypothetical protein ACFSBZ_03185 [Amnibacterium flavum]|uniref:Uncharacterized protein n=1 Tax=Amnibacterium flavum TaxID=2173173 RepID=A0A2V1HVR9_9MICO|nr:hypothetical protein [Amnibacterium flavum]PVZ94477.1 hypothetical protein DDQ50_12280 [Amnibacterium flavum]